MKKLVSLLLVAVMSLSLVACGKSVESVLSDSANQEGLSIISSMFKQAYGDGADCQLSANGNDLVVEMTFPVELTEEQADQMAQNIEANSSELDSQIDNMKTQFETQFEVKPSKVTFVIKDSTGATICEYGK